MAEPKQSPEPQPLISAAEARALDPMLKAPAVLAQLDKLIREAAAKGKKEVRVPYELITASGYSIRFSTPGIQEALQEAGYEVQARSEERQFVDVWLEISWRAKA